MLGFGPLNSLPHAAAKVPVAGIITAKIVIVPTHRVRRTIKPTHDAAVRTRPAGIRI